MFINCTCILNELHKHSELVYILKICVLTVLNIICIVNKYSLLVNKYLEKNDTKKEENKRQSWQE